MSVASLRADSLTPALVEALAVSGHKTVTLAPEAASVKLRQVINKSITNEHLLDAIAMTVKAGIANVKLYIMVGLPTESDEDITAIVTLARLVKKHMESLGSSGKLTLSINPFIPKPFTPFQWVPMAEFGVVEKRLRHIQLTLKSDKGIEVQTESPREAFLQGVLARGDRRLGAILLAAHQRGGPKGWRNAVKEAGLDEAFYLYRQRALDETLPWQHLEMGFDNNYLAKEYTQAGQARTTAPCAAGCTRCGICVEERKEGTP